MSKVFARYSIWDIDNCVADDSWREPLIEWHKQGNERYREYNKRVAYDPVRNVSVFRVFQKFTTPIFLTGRSEEFSGLTMQWLQRRLDLVSPLVYFRGQEETLRPADLKQRMLMDLLKRIDREQIVVAFDDLDAIVEMYQSHGIPAVRLAINNSTTAYAPSDLSPATKTY